MAPHSQEPLNPQRLVTILAHLLPPSYPLAPDLLSSAIKTRQLYLPPNPSNPHDDRFIAQRPSSSTHAEEEQDPEDLSTRLQAIADSRLHARDHEFSNEVQLQGEGNDIEVALYREAWNVRYRALDGETLIAKLDLALGSDDEQRGVRILFVPEDESDGGDPADESARIQPIGEDHGAGGVYRSQISMGDEWKLFDVKPLEQALAEEQRSTGGQEAWVSTPREAFERIKGPKTSHGDGDVGGEDQPEEDYWGGYSDSDHEEEKQSAEVPTEKDVHKADRTEAANPTKDLPATGLPAAVAGGTSSLPAQSYTNPLSTTTNTHSPPVPAANVHPTNALPQPSVPATVVTKKVSISPFVSRFNTPMGGHDDAYWSSYGGVEDGLKASNPPSPKGVSRFTTPAGGYWGTGGESPVSWSPPPTTQALPSASLGQTASTLPTKPAQDTTTDTRRQFEQAATTAGRRTDAIFESHEGHLDLSSPVLDFAPGSPVLEPSTDAALAQAASDRQTALRTTLTGLKYMHLNSAAQGVDRIGLEIEFAEVLREFL